MKNFCPLLLGAAMSFGAVFAAQLRTVDGKIYRDVQFSRVNEKGLVFMHSNGMITLKPDKLNRLDRKKYAMQISEYEDFAGGKRAKTQKEFDSKVAALKNMAFAPRLLKLAELKRFYSTRYFTWAKLKFDKWEQAVSDAYEQFEKESSSMNIGNALYYARRCQAEYKNFDAFADKFTALLDVLSADAIEKFPQQVNGLKSMNAEQKLKQAEILLKSYETLPVDFDELRRIAVEAQGEIDITKLISKFSKSTDHSQAIGELGNVIAKYPTHRMLQDAVKLKEYHVMCLDTKDNFDFIISYYSKNQSVAFRVMAKALKIYTDSPYAANAKKTYDVWQKKKKEEEAKAKAEKDSWSTGVRSVVDTFYPCNYCKGRGRINGDECSYCDGEGYRVESTSR